MYIAPEIAVLGVANCRLGASFLRSISPALGSPGMDHAGTRACGMRSGPNESGRHVLRIVVAGGQLVLTQQLKTARLCDIGLDACDHAAVPYRTDVYTAI